MKTPKIIEYIQNNQCVKMKENIKIMELVKKEGDKKDIQHCKKLKIKIK